MDIFLTKINDCLKPAYEADNEKLSKFKTGALLECRIVQKRNVKFHRKYFALLNIGFDYFDPEPVDEKGRPVLKNFERFRKDIVISTGRYDCVANINGDVRAEAHSISFAKMNQDEFDGLYSDTINVILQKVMREYSREQIDSWVNQILDFS